MGSRVVGFLIKFKKSAQYLSGSKQKVRPIFYKVDPSDVRNQKGSFGKALGDHDRVFKDDEAKLLRWKKALREIAGLSGWAFSDGYESKFIDNIVEEISIQVINCTYLNVAKHPVGIESRVGDMHKLLDIKENDVRMVGIWGTGGIGKTTIAKAVYNSISHKFEGSCFMEKVRETSIPYGGLVKLQRFMLYEILGARLKVTNVDQGINVIKKRLSHKRVLLILDDVNNFDQLNKLAGGFDWFGLGSRVIITTRDKHLLAVHQVSAIYQVKELDHHEALKLFQLNAFSRNNIPVEDYVERAIRDVVRYAQGLPLVLVVLGSLLYGRSVNQWRAALNGYRRVPNQEIYEILKTSYNALEDPVKEVFLDMTCFFKGKNKKYVIQILEGCDLDPKYAIEVLIEKALIYVDKENRISMHDLLEEMGKEIVRQQSPIERGKRSRLWFHEDVHHVLTEKTGTSKIQGIMVNLSKSDEISLSAKSFSKMKNLRLFISCNARFTGDVDYLPNELRFLDWPGCPLQTLPSNFNPKKLVELNMPDSRISLFGEGFKSLPNLKSINLKSCQFLTKVGNLSGVPNLEDLNLDDCTSLVEIHPSVGFLDKLVHLSLKRCYNLRMIVRKASWKSLRNITLEHCRGLESFPEVVGKMEFLKNLSLTGTAIKGLPASISFLINLEILNLDSCFQLEELPCSIYELQHLLKLSASQCPKLVALPNKMNSQVSLDSFGSSLALPKLWKLNVGGCNLSESDFLLALDCVPTLEKLDLSGSNFVSIPLGINKFANLCDLNLGGCHNMREIPVLPPKIKRVDASNCVSLERVSNLSNILECKGLQMIRWMDFSNCNRLRDNSLMNQAAPFSLFLSSKESEFNISFPGSEVPTWFHYRRQFLFEKEFSVAVTRSFNWDNKGLAVCAAYEPKKHLSNGRRGHSLAKIHINRVCLFDHWILWAHRESPHMWLYYIPFTRMLNGSLVPPFTCRVSFNCMSVRFKTIGVHLVRIPKHLDEDVEASREDISPSVEVKEDIDAGYEDLEDEYMRAVKIMRRST